MSPHEIAPEEIRIRRLKSFLSIELSIMIEATFLSRIFSFGSEFRLNVSNACYGLSPLASSYEDMSTLKA